MQTRGIYTLSMYNTQYIHVMSYLKNYIFMAHYNPQLPVDKQKENSQKCKVRISFKCPLAKWLGDFRVKSSKEPINQI